MSDISKIYLEMLDKSQEYDWDNPYIGDMNELRRRQDRVDMESGREDSSQDYYDRADANINRTRFFQQEKTTQKYIDKIIQDIVDISDEIINWENSYSSDYQEFENRDPGNVGDVDTYDGNESYEELERIVSELHQIDLTVKKLSHESGAQDKFYDTLKNILNNNDIHSDELNTVEGQVILSILNCRVFMSKYPHVYEGNANYSTIIETIRTVYEEINYDKSQKREEEREANKSSKYTQFTHRDRGQNSVDLLIQSARQLGINIPNNIDKNGIKGMHRQIVSRIHPDKVKGESEKKKAHDQFVNYINNIWEKIPKHLKENVDIFDMIYQKIVLG